MKDYFLQANRKMTQHAGMNAAVWEKEYIHHQKHLQHQAEDEKAGL